MMSLPHTLPRALALSIAQLGDRAILKVLGKSAALTLAIFLGFGWGLSFGFDWGLAQLGLDQDNGLSAFLAVLVAVIGAWFLFRVVALAVVQLFADEIVSAVEARHYPEAAAAARDLPLVAEIGQGLRALARTLAVNLVALPFALVLLITGVGTALLFWFVNALLLGREFQDMVALRHRSVQGQEAPAIGKLTRFLLGGVVAALLAIPFINLLAPIIGAASATHLIHGGRARDASA